MAVHPPRWGLAALAAALLAGGAAGAAHADDGGPDTTFGTNGAALATIPGTPAPDQLTINALVRQADGRLYAVGSARFGGSEVVAGTAKNGGNDFFVLVRYNADGSLDTSFGGDGIVTTLFPAVGGQIPGGIVRIPDGRLVVGGSARLTNGGKAVALARYGRGSCTGFLGCVTLVQISPSTILVSADLIKAHTVGILVSRVRHGHARRVGRVPLGRRHAGNVHIRWHRRVGGKRLKAGTYRVRLRALRHGRVVAVSKPIRIRIRR